MSGGACGSKAEIKYEIFFRRMSEPRHTNISAHTGKWPLALAYSTVNPGLWGSGGKSCLPSHPGDTASYALEILHVSTHERPISLDTRTTGSIVPCSSDVHDFQNPSDNAVHVPGRALLFTTLFAIMKSNIGLH